MKIEHVAKICHEANRALCETLNDFSLKPWELTTADIKASAVAGVKFAVENPDATGEQQHQQWCDYKRGQGWTYGVNKDAAAKTHPSLVPYYELPELVRRKDDLFRHVVRAFAGLIET